MTLINDDKAESKNYIKITTNKLSSLATARRNIFRLIFDSQFLILDSQFMSPIVAMSQFVVACFSFLFF